jgi:Flagellar hook-length control protein FliK
MTRAGGIGEQMAMPSKITTGAARASGAPTDGTAALGEMEAEFVDLLAKLQNTGSRQPDGADSNLPEENPLPVERKAGKSNLNEEQLTALDCLACDDVVNVSDLETNANVDTASDVESADSAAVEAEQSEDPESPKTESTIYDPSKMPAAAPPQDGATSALSGLLPAQDGQKAVDDRRPVPPPPSSGKKVIADEQVGDDTRRVSPPVDVAVSSAKQATQPLPTDPVSANEPVPKAKVLQQETHFAPSKAASQTLANAVSAVANSKQGAGLDAKGNESSSTPVNVELLVGEQTFTAPQQRPVQQIADRIAAEVSAFDAPSQVRAESIQSSASPTVKVLQIQLQPAELGTVTVRLELKQTELELHVEVSRGETAEMIRADKDSLSNLLRSAGYSLDTASIRVVEVDRTGATSAQSGQQGAQTNLQSSGQSQSGWSQRGERTPQENAGTNQNGGAQVSGNPNDAHGTTSHRANGGLYI